MRSPRDVVQCVGARFEVKFPSRPLKGAHCVRRNAGEENLVPVVRNALTPLTPHLKAPHKGKQEDSETLLLRAQPADFACYSSPPFSPSHLHEGPSLGSSIDVPALPPPLTRRLAWPLSFRSDARPRGRC